MHIELDGIGIYQNGKIQVIFPMRENKIQVNAALYQTEGNQSLLEFKVGNIIELQEVMCVVAQCAYPTSPDYEKERKSLIENVCQLYTLMDSESC